MQSLRAESRRFRVVIAAASLVGLMLGEVKLAFAAVALSHPAWEYCETTRVEASH